MELESQLKQPVDPEDDIFVQSLQLKKQHRKKVRMEKNSMTMEKLIAQCRLSATDAMATDRCVFVCVWVCVGGCGCVCVFV